MATSSLSGRIKRLERSMQQTRVAAAGGQLIMRLRRFFDPDGTPTGIKVNQEFIAREAGETIADTERRAIEQVGTGPEPAAASYQQIVRLNMTPVEELPE